MKELELKRVNEEEVEGKCRDECVRIAMTTRYDPAKGVPICENSWIRAYCKAEVESVNYEEKV